MFSLRPGSDVVPYVDGEGKEFRLNDIDVIDHRAGDQYFFEAKDHGRLVYPQHRNGTGLPMRYIDFKLKYLGIDDVYIVFRDNVQILDAVAEKGRCSRTEAIAIMGFCKTESDGVPVFEPYGERLSVLMEHRLPSSEERCKSIFRQYYKESQYIWDIRYMKGLDTLIDSIASGSKTK